MNRSSAGDRKGFERVGHLRAERGLRRALDEQVPPESTAEAGEGSRGGTVDLQCHRILPQQRPKLLSRLGRSLLLRAGNEQTNEAGERGEGPLLAAHHLGEQRKGPLTRSEVGEVQADVR